MAKEQTEANKESGPQRNTVKSLFLIVLGVVICLGIYMMFFRNETVPTKQNGSNATDTLTVKKDVVAKEIPNPERLKGKWQRTDGDYMIEVVRTNADGTAETGYFNPNPIHVARSEWIVDQNILYLMVELQDVNYPGSIYGLQYDPTADKLSGMYFQAVEENTYQVEFERKKD